MKASEECRCFLDYDREEEDESNRGWKDHGEQVKLWGEGFSKQPYQRGNRPQNNFKNNQDKFKTLPPSPCFICSGPHWTQVSPRKNNNTLVAKEDDEPKEERKEVQLETIKVLNSVKTQAPPKKSSSATTLSLWKSRYTTNRSMPWLTQVHQTCFSWAKRWSDWDFAWNRPDIDSRQSTQMTFQPWALLKTWKYKSVDGKASLISRYSRSMNMISSWEWISSIVQEPW